MLNGSSSCSSAITAATGGNRGERKTTRPVCTSARIINRGRHVFRARLPPPERRLRIFMIVDTFGWRGPGSSSSRRRHRQLNAALGHQHRRYWSEKPLLCLYIHTKDTYISITHTYICALDWCTLTKGKPGGERRINRKLRLSNRGRRSSSRDIAITED